MTNGNYLGDFSNGNEMKKREATVVCEADSVIGYIDKHTFTIKMHEETAKIEEEESHFLNKLILFSNIKYNNFKGFYFHKFNLLELLEDEKVLQQGSHIRDVYILRQGTVNVYAKCNILDII